MTRKIDLGLAKIEVFDNERKALKAYEAAERRQRERKCKTGRPGDTCVLLGADRLGTLLKTHADWFDEPVDMNLVRDLAVMAAASNGGDQR